MKIDRRHFILTSSSLLLAGLPHSSRSEPTAALYSSHFPSLAAAFDRWRTVGGTLVIDMDHLEAKPITMACVPGLSYRLTTVGIRTVAYSGPQYHWFICIYSEGRNPFAIDGLLTIDGRNNCCIPFFARFENVGGDARREFRVDGLTATNARMKAGVSRIDGSRTNAYGAAAMLFSGGFDTLRLAGIKAANVTREAGSGVLGSQGCVGVGVVGQIGSTRSARSVLVENFEIANIDSDDPPGSVERADMDGLLIFQSAEKTGSRPVVRHGIVREAAGRAVKVYAPGGGGLTSDIAVYRSRFGATRMSNDIAHQHGDGVIENITFHYSGNANAYPTVPIGMSAGQVRDPAFPFGAGVIRSIAIHDTTRQAKLTLVTLFFNLRDAAPRIYRLSDIRDEGSAQSLFMPGGLGTYQDTFIDIDKVDVDLTKGLLSSEDYDRKLRIRARHFTNRNRRVAAFKAFYDGHAAPPGHGGVIDRDSTVVGVAHE